MVRWRRNRKAKLDLHGACMQYLTLTVARKALPDDPGLSTQSLAIHSGYRDYVYLENNGTLETAQKIARIPSHD
jgi:hypothetical protein